MRIITGLFMVIFVAIAWVYGLGLSAFTAIGDQLDDTATFFQNLYNNKSKQ